MLLLRCSSGCRSPTSREITAELQTGDRLSRKKIAPVAGDDTVQKNIAEAAQQAAKKAAEYKANADKARRCQSGVSGRCQGGILATAEAIANMKCGHVPGIKSVRRTRQYVMGTARYEHYDENRSK